MRGIYKRMKKNIYTCMAVVIICFVLAFIIGGNCEFLIGYIINNFGVSIPDNIGVIEGPTAQFVISENIVPNLFVLFLALSIIMALLYKVIIKIIVLLKNNSKN